MNKKWFSFLLAAILVIALPQALFARVVAYEIISLDGSTPATPAALSDANFGVNTYFEAFYTFDLGAGNVARYRIDGGTVTTTNGHKVEDGGWLKLTNVRDAKNFQAIMSTGTAGTITVSYSLSSDGR